MNFLGPELVADLVSLIQQADADSRTRVLVFASADREYFIAHVDVTRIAEYRDQPTKLAEDFCRDSDLFAERSRASDTQARIGAAMKRGFQTQDAELAPGRIVAEL
jgi:enoyl-CoA hydratase/carnithine racemase